MASPTYTSTNLHRGPGTLTYGSQKLHSQEKISADVKVETWRPKVSTHGEGAPRISDATGEISFTPSGIITQAIIDLLYPAALRNPTPGLRLFPASDVALLIHGIDTYKVQFTRAALHNMPTLKLSPKATAFGEATFHALIAQAASRETAGSFYTLPTAAAWSEIFSDSNIVAGPYNALWGSTPILTEDGFEISFDLGLNAIYIDSIGTVDYEVESVGVSATCTPVNMSASQLLAAKHAEGMALGSSLRSGDDLVITSELTGGLVVSLFDAVLGEGPAQWQANASRTGQITFTACRSLTGEGASTTLDKIFDITLVPEPEA